MTRESKKGAPSGHGDPTLGDIVEAVANIVVESGPDAVQLSPVAGVLGCSLAHIEETYGHPGELLYVAWKSMLESEFDALVAQARRLVDSAPGSDRAGRSASPMRQAAVHLLVVSHRFDELRESVPFDVQRILYSHERGLTSVADRSTYRAVVGWLIGIALEPGGGSGDSLQLFEHIDFRPEHRRQVPHGSHLEPTPPLALVFDEVGDMSQEILGACTRIIAQGGLVRATLLRIARMAGYPPEVLFGMYGRQEDLIAQYVHLVFRLLFSYRRFEQYMSSTALATMRLQVWLEPELRTRRQALTEAAMASNFSPLLEAAYSSAAEHALLDLRLAHLDRSEGDVMRAGLRFVASRQVALGLAVLVDVELDSGSREWDAFLGDFLSTSS